MNPKIIFMGTPEFAVTTLQRLINDKYNIVAVVTQPDKPVGRHQDTLQPPPVKVCAQQHNIPVLQPEKMKDPQFIQQLRAYNADIFVVVAFRMLPEVVWAMPPYGTFNVHAALLPQYRGAAPINWAIINGETQTGVTTFFLDHNIDTGRIIQQKTFDIPDHYNAEDLYNGLMHLAADIATETLQQIIATNGNPQTFDQQALLSQHPVLGDSFAEQKPPVLGGSVAEPLHPAPKIFRETCQINWHQPSKRVYDFIRGLSPYPGAWTMIQDIQTDPNSAPCTLHSALNLKIFRTTKTTIDSTAYPPGTALIDKKRLLVATTDCFLSLETIQQQGKKRTEAKDFLNGFRP